MGLDMYAYARPPRKRNSDEDVGICDWRKHNRLQGWMQNLWESKGCPNQNTEDDPMGDFNCVEIQLTRDDLHVLESDIRNFELPEANGFFWGSDSYFWNNEDDEPYPENEYYYKEQDLNFIAEAHKMLDKDYRVFYNSWY
ncbi:MAG: hypothetical protein MUQ75_00250 [Crocinitomicaceae bacterium]|nr:hypothetical protein [Crocinitomicaceae bacterium]